MDRLADLLHNVDDQKQPVFAEGDIERLEMDLFPGKTEEDVGKELELEWFKRQTLKQTMHPLELIDAISPDVGYLKEAFEGFETGVLKAKDQSLTPQQLEKMAKALSANSPNKVYKPYVDPNGTRFLVEWTLGVPNKIQDIEEASESTILPIILQVTSSEAEKVGD